MNNLSLLAVLHCTLPGPRIPVGSVTSEGSLKSAMAEIVTLISVNVKIRAFLRGKPTTSSAFTLLSSTNMMRHKELNYAEFFL